MILTDKQKFQQRQLLPLEQKEILSLDRIKKFVNWCEDNDLDVYQSDSFGKDSTVVRHLIQRLGLNSAIPSVFSNTGLEFKEMLKYGRRSRTNLIEVKPKKNYQKVWQEDGLPIGSKMTAKKLRVLQEGLNGKNANMHHLYDTGITSDGRKAPSYKLANKWRHLIDNEYGLKFTDKCCDHLKKEPLDTFQKQFKGGRIDGMMAAEGGKRADKHVCTIFNDKKPQSSPILFWTESDVWEYIEKYNLEVCEVYYSRVFNEDGDCVACDSPFTDHPLLSESHVLDLKVSRCEGTDSGYFGDLGSWAEFVDDSGYEKKYYYYIEGEKRTGCSFCGFGAHLEKGANRFQRLSVMNPRLHKLIMERMGMGKALELINVKVDFGD